MGLAKNGNNAAANGKTTEPEIKVFGYCVHCRSREQMLGTIQVCNRRGGRDLKGHCAVCGKSMYRLGGWDSIAAQEAKAAPHAAETMSGDDEALRTD